MGFSVLPYLKGCRNNLVFLSREGGNFGFERVDLTREGKREEIKKGGGVCFV